MCHTQYTRKELGCAGRNVKRVDNQRCWKYKSDSANKNDATGDPSSNLKLATHTSDVKKSKITDTSNGNLQQND